jgi:serine/threonine protein kinase
MSEQTLKFLEGQIIEKRYRLVQHLKEGNFGAVFHGQQCLFDEPVRDVAVKISKKTGLTKETAREVFGEAILLAKVHDRIRDAEARSYIVPVHDLGILEEHDRRGFIVMGLICGKGSTSEMIVPPRTFEAEIGNYTKGVGPEPALAFFRRICTAMAVVHAQNVIHRDLKPDNILMTETGDIRIVDFGLAAGLNDAGFASGSVGTYRYMAPETASSGESDARADVYTLGIVLYQMLTNHYPFEKIIPPPGLTHEEGHKWTLKQKQHVEIRKPSEYNRQVSSELDLLVMDCLSVTPNGRPADASDLLKRISQLDDPVSRLLDDIAGILDVGWRKWIGGKPNWSEAFLKLQEAEKKCGQNRDDRWFRVINLMALCCINMELQSEAFRALDMLKTEVERGRFIKNHKEQAEFYQRIAKVLGNTRMKAYAAEYKVKAEAARNKSVGQRG